MIETAKGGRSELGSNNGPVFTLHSFEIKVSILISTFLLHYHAISIPDWHLPYNYTQDKYSTPSFFTVEQCTCKIEYRTRVLGKKCHGFRKPFFGSAMEEMFG